MNCSMGKDSTPTNISREFLKLRARNIEPFCSRPWRVLKIKLNGRTKICCDFATSLPTFDFPTARDFHKRTGMWNHPFMQHMRRTMGRTDEVPYCRLCLTADKRSPKYHGARMISRAATKKLYRELDDAQRKLTYRGTLENAPENLADYRIALTPGRDYRPFSRTRTAYRRTVSDLGFARKDRVLLFGCQAVAMAPFLAESCRELVIADRNENLLRRAETLCRAFDLGVTAHVIGPENPSPVGDDFFDGIWVHGPSLCHENNTMLLRDFSRLLSHAGTLRVQYAPAVGRLFSSIADVSVEAASRANLLDLLRAGLGEQNEIRFVATADLRTLMRRHNLALDIARPIGRIREKFFPVRSALLAALGDDYDRQMRRYSSELSHSDGQMESMLSFSARRVAARDC